MAPLKTVESLYVVGRGAGYAAAQEAALKLKETCGIHGEALSAAEIMHGPLALAGPDFPVILFSQRDEALASLTELAAGLVARGVPVIAAGPASRAATMPLPGGRRAQSFRPADRADPELLSARRGARPRPRPRPRPAAASPQGDGDAMMGGLAHNATPRAVVQCAVQRDSGAPQTRNPEGVNCANCSLGVPGLQRTTSCCAAPGMTRWGTSGSARGCISRGGRG